MIRTIKSQPLNRVSCLRSSALARRSTQGFGLDFMPRQPIPLTPELVSGIGGLVTEVVGVVKAIEYRKVTIAQCHRDEHLSDNEVLKALIAHDTHIAEQHTELARLSADVQLQFRRMDSDDMRFQEISRQIEEAFQHYRETGDPTCIDCLPMLIARLSPPLTSND